MKRLIAAVLLAFWLPWPQIMAALGARELLPMSDDTLQQFGRWAIVALAATLLAYLWSEPKANRKDHK